MPILSDEERRRRLAQQATPQQGLGRGRRLDGKQSSIGQSAANGSFGNKDRESRIPSFNDQSTRQEGFNPPAGPAFDSGSDSSTFFDPPAGPAFDSGRDKSQDKLLPDYSKIQDTTTSSFEPEAGDAFDPFDDGGITEQDAIDQASAPSPRVAETAQLFSEAGIPRDEEEDEFGFDSTRRRRV